MNRFASEHTPPCNELSTSVGVSLLAKTICQASENQCMYGPLREQAPTGLES